MQIRRTPDAGRYQLVFNKYSSEKKRSVAVNIGSVNLFKPVPMEVLQQLSTDEQSKLYAFLAQELSAMDLTTTLEFAENLPEKLQKMGETWSAISAKIGKDRASELLEKIDLSFKSARKAIKKSSSAEVE